MPIQDIYTYTHGWLCRSTRTETASAGTNSTSGLILVSLADQEKENKVIKTGTYKATNN